MYVNSISVELSTLGGMEIVISDSVDAGSGASALASLKSRSQIDTLVTDNGATKRLIVPYHAVVAGVATVARTQAEDPIDYTCPSESTQNPEEPSN